MAGLAGPFAKRRPAVDRSAAKMYLVGGGIASLAAAAFMIRDGDIRGHNITILEELAQLGGSLDAAGVADSGYVMRGGRMLESKYLCTYDLFASIPTLDGAKTVTQEIFDWNNTMKTSSKSRLVRDGRRETAPPFGLSENHIVGLEQLALASEISLGTIAISDWFEAAFFKTDFWFMWCTTFAFQPWHSAVEFRRYLLRFAHMVGGFNRLEGIMRTVYNQFDSLVRPLHKFLNEHGVTFDMATRVTDLTLAEVEGQVTVEQIAYVRNGVEGKIPVASVDCVFVTLGSMTEGSSFGSMDTVPQLRGKKDGGSWSLWQKLSTGRPQFGRPQTFADHVDQSKWVSFTTTLREPTLLRIIRDLTGNAPGEGGLITFPDSNWLLSMVIPHQPHFIDQPKGVGVFWGYGLTVDRPGNFVKKSMSACTGREIMMELAGHLRIEAERELVIANCVCIPCMMPFITSQFLPRQSGDRPQVIPRGSNNLAFMGQFCEIPEDVVFTVEYSIRSAQAAVYGMLGLKREPPPVYRGRFNPRVLYKAFLALHDLPA